MSLVCVLQTTIGLETKVWIDMRLARCTTLSNEVIVAVPLDEIFHHFPLLNRHFAPIAAAKGAGQVHITKLCHLLRYCLT